MIYYLLFIFILGIIVGSFLNVVILRYETGLSIMRGHSRCFSCGKELSWFELVPILSFLAQRGHCRSCGSGLSLQYPLVEIMTGVIFTTIFAKFNTDNFSLALLVLYLLIFSTLIVIVVYDLRHKIIPDGLVIFFIIFSLVVALLNFYNNSYLITLSATGGSAYGGNTYINLFAGLILFIPFYALWRFSDGKWIGLGDGKLAIGIGTLLGLAGGLSAVVLGFWIGAAFALIVLFLNRFAQGLRLWKGISRLTMKSEIPFAPFLILGTTVVFLYPLDIFSLHLFGF
ncbi:MAG: prepilin peptidase [bacterium]|nr:prepilin peptidase [bacterium]